MTISKGRPRPDWDHYALILATAAAERSEDPYVQVGACVLREDHSVAAVGYNGPPPGITVDWGNRDGRRPLMIHAEMNALRYTKPYERLSLLAATLMPCAECIKNAASYGIRRIVYATDFTKYQAYDGDLTRGIARNFGIELVHVLD